MVMFIQVKALEVKVRERTCSEWNVEKVNKDLKHLTGHVYFMNNVTGATIISINQSVSVA